MGVSSLSAKEILGALTLAKEATFVWSPEKDTLEWASDPAEIMRFADRDAPTSGKAWTGLLSAGDVEAREKWLGQKTAAEPFVGIYRIGGAGAQCWIEERLVALGDNETGERRFLGRLRNVSADRENFEKLSYLARFDELTGHLSRSHLRAVLARRMTAADHDGQKICFGLIGLDNLAGFNSMFGYDIADVVLTRIGEAIAAHVGPDDVIGRIGSSKFAVLFADCPKHSLHERLSAIQAAIREGIIETGAGPVAVTVSAAGLTVPDDASTTHDVFAVAEDTLNGAKSRGVDQVLIYTPDPSAIAAREDNITIADDIIAALHENRLCLAYQPIVQARDPKEIAFHECLLRLVDRSGKLVNAGAFMPVAEKLGLVRMLDRRVIELAFDTLRRNPRVRLSVNVSPQSLRDASWQSRFEALAAAHPQVLDRLILEMTEATVIEDAEEAATRLNRFRDMGCSVALDDFGAGYTSFQQLRDLTIDIVKIDGTYIRNILDNPNDQVFVEALCGIAQHHDLLIVAEMVDSDEAGALLQSLGVDTFQGFHFGRPDVEPDWLASDAAPKVANG